VTEVSSQEGTNLWVPPTAASTSLLVFLIKIWVDLGASLGMLLPAFTSCFWANLGSASLLTDLESSILREGFDLALFGGYWVLAAGFLAGTASCERRFLIYEKLLTLLLLVTARPGCSNRAEALERNLERAALVGVCLVRREKSPREGSLLGDTDLR
jgi:hypothetical protein